VLIALPSIAPASRATHLADSSPLVADDELQCQDANYRGGFGNRPGTRTNLPTVSLTALFGACMQAACISLRKDATAHDLELRPNGRRKFCFLLADSHCVGAPSLASAAFG